MKVKAYDGSQFWDTAFAGQAYAYTLKAMENHPKLFDRNTKDILEETVDGICAFTERSQIRENVRDARQFFRPNTKGGWPFSTQDHGYPTSDCTSEGVKLVLLLREFDRFRNNKHLREIDDSRLDEAVEIILSLHNPHNEKFNRAWSSYEANRGTNGMKF